MGISDYLWPFERKFSQIPCARESAIAALLGGPCAGALVIILTSKGILAYKTSIFSSLGIFWISFGVCRYQHAQYRETATQFKEGMRSGRID